MKKIKVSHAGKQLIEFCKQELLAIIAVGVVLFLLFSQALAATQDLAESLSLATQVNTQQTSNQTITDISGPAGGQELFRGQPTIQFGTGIKGYNRPEWETWQSTVGIKNEGTYLTISNNNEVKIMGVENGTFRVWIKGFGKMTINGIALDFKTISTFIKNLTVSSGTITIDFTAGSQIYAISTLPLGPETNPETLASIPDSIAVLPNQSTITINPHAPTTFNPLAIIIDTTGKQMTITPGLLIWTSSNRNIATVDSSGLVTVLKPGLVTITVQVNGTELVAATSLMVRPMVEPPLVDITPLAATNSSTGATAEAAPSVGNQITDFFATLLNLKPSSAANPATLINPNLSNIATYKPTTSSINENSNSVIAPTANQAITNTTTVIQQLMTTLKKGITVTANFFQQTLGNWIRELR